MRFPYLPTDDRPFAPAVPSAGTLVDGLRALSALLSLFSRPQVRFYASTGDHCKCFSDPIAANHPVLVAGPMGGDTHALLSTLLCSNSGFPRTSLAIVGSALKRNSEFFLSSNFLNRGIPIFPLQFEQECDFPNRFLPTMRLSLFANFARSSDHTLRGVDFLPPLRCAPCVSLSAPIQAHRTFRGVAFSRGPRCAPIGAA